MTKLVMDALALDCTLPSAFVADIIIDVDPASSLDRLNVWVVGVYSAPVAALGT